MPDHVVVVRIELNGFLPKIWRRVALSVESSLFELHEIIQVLFEWYDCHYWEFWIGSDRFSSSEFSEDSFFDEVRDAEDYILADFLHVGINKMTYVYDFGDDWRHSIRLGAVRPAKPDINYPHLIAGERDAPMEEIDENLLEIYEVIESNLSSDVEEYDELSEDDAPDEFDIEEFRERLKDVKSYLYDEDS